MLPTCSDERAETWIVGFMTNEDIVIELADEDDAAERFLGPAQRATDSVAADVARVRAIGSARRPAALVDDDRRMEEWIASHLDLDLTVCTAEACAAPGPDHRQPAGPEAQAQRKGRESRRQCSTLDSWKRFHVAYKRGITVVRLLDKTLVKESQIRELACDLST